MLNQPTRAFDAVEMEPMFTFATVVSVVIHTLYHFLFAAARSRSVVSSTLVDVLMPHTHTHADHTRSLQQSHPMSKMVHRQSWLAAWLSG